MSKIFSQFFSQNSRKERFFYLCLMACAFFISFEYGITRSASNSIFISTYGTRYIPYVWLTTVPINFCVIYLYNRFLPKLGFLRMFFLIIATAIGLNTFAAFFITKIPPLSFVQTIWEDLYILLMFQQLWSFIHSTVKVKDAKYIYGIIFGFGGIGSVCGSVIPAFLATYFGSEKLFLFTAPMYLSLFAFYYLAVKNSRLNDKEGEEEWKETYSLSKEKNNFFIRHSRVMVCILLLVIFMQISIAFVDYQFNLFLEQKIADMDLRTEYMGRMHTIINAFTTGFQFVGGLIFVQFLGLRGSHLFVPLLLGGNALFMLLFPCFPIASYSYISIKSIDYSLFGIIREMLYLPRKLDEKFRSKAIIDVFAYRSAKAFASFFILFIHSIDWFDFFKVIGFVALVVYAGWVFLVQFLFSKHKSEIMDVQT